MEDVLALYALPYDARYPTVCLDEKPVVLHAEVRPCVPLAPGQVERRDYEYERHGAANLPPISSSWSNPWRVGAT